MGQEVVLAGEVVWTGRYLGSGKKIGLRDLKRVMQTGADLERQQRAQRKEEK